MKKFPIVIIFLIGLLYVLPPLFSSGAIFDIHDLKVNDCGEIEDFAGVYFDNVYYLLVYILLTFLGFSLPYVFNLNISWSRVSNLLGGWGFFALLVEILNFNYPTLVLNTMMDDIPYLNFLLSFILGLIFIIIYETWNKQKNLKKL